MKRENSVKEEGDIISSYKDEIVSGLRVALEASAVQSSDGDWRIAVNEVISERLCGENTHSSN